MSVEALQAGAQKARNLADEVLCRSLFQTPGELGRKLIDLSQALEEAARSLPPEGGANPTNRGAAKTAAHVWAQRVRELLTAYKGEEYYRDRKDIMMDLDFAVDALLDKMGSHPEAARMDAVRAWGGQNYVEEQDLHVDPATLKTLRLFGLLSHMTVRHRSTQKPVRVFCLTQEHRRLWSRVRAMKAVEMMGGDRG